MNLDFRNQFSYNENVEIRIIQARSLSPGIWRPTLGLTLYIESVFEIMKFRILHPDDRITENVCLENILLFPIIPFLGTPRIGALFTTRARGSAVLEGFGSCCVAVFWHGQDFGTYSRTGARATSMSFQGIHLRGSAALFNSRTT